MYLKVSASVGHLAMIRVCQLGALPLLPDTDDMSHDIIWRHLTWCRTSHTVHHKGRVSARSDSHGPVTNCSWEPQCQSIIIAKVMMMSTSQGGHQFHSTLNITWTHFLTQVIPAAETSNSFLAGQFRSLNDESSLLQLTMARVLCYLSTSLGNFWPSPNVLLCDRSKDMINPNIIML